MARVHYLHTPKKNRIREALLNRPPGVHKTDIFRRFKISHTTGYKILREPEEREGRTKYGPETRGRKKILSESDVQQIIRFVQTNGFDSRTIPYAALPAATGLEVECSSETVRRALKPYGFRFYQAYQKKHLSNKAKERRVEYARYILEEYPEKKD